VLDSGTDTVYGQHFDYRNGLRGILGFHDFGGNWATKTPDGKLWFSTNTGLAVIDPRHITSNPLPPPVWIQSVRAGGRTYPIGEKQPLPSNARNYEFQYVALSFTDPDKVRYRYRLEGFDSNWVDAEKRREAFYSNLRPGSYRFHVIACNNDGVWNETGRAVTFSIRPAFYETLWFPILCAIPIALGLWVWHRLRFARLARGLNQRLEVQQEERKRIAQELHDTLLQGFTGVGLKLEAIATRLPDSLASTRDSIHTILDDSDRYLAEARRAVWALRSTSFAEANDFPSVLSNTCRQLLQGTGIEFTFTSTGTSRALPTSTEDQLLRICQEAFANILLHSGADAVCFGCLEERRGARDGGLTFAQDNGQGFTADSRPSGGRGLANMQARAKSIHAEFGVTSQPGAGTRVTVWLSQQR